ncbi:hypothetical protein ACS0TY_018433 [Phlomoides rotata]
MENTDSNCLGLQKVRKNGGRRSWKPYEEVILMGHLKELVAVVTGRQRMALGPAIYRGWRRRFASAYMGLTLGHSPTSTSRYACGRNTMGAFS